VSTGPPLGWLSDASYTVGEATVDSGDCILLMTDGIEESFAEDGTAFGRERIFQTVAQLAEQTVAVQAQGILDAVNRFTSGKQQDDMTVLLTRLT
jgi:sigma-B regulation protein RsbU (phosphoserine phosphatase)